MTLSNYKIYTGDMKDIVIEEGIEVLVGDELGTTGITEAYNPDKVMCLRFNDIKNCQTVTMPDSVRIIGPKAFGGCSKLLDIEFSRNLEEIHMQSFQNCSSLKYLEIPPSVKKIEGWAFASNSIEELYYLGSIIDLDKILSESIAMNIHLIKCNDCTVDFTNNNYIEELNYPGTVEEWKSGKVAQWIQNRTKKVICCDGVVER